MLKHLVETTIERIILLQKSPFVAILLYISKKSSTFAALLK